MSLEVSDPIIGPVILRMNHTCVFLNLTPFKYFRNAFEFDLFMHSPLRHLGSFQLLSILNAMDVLVHAFWRSSVQISFRYIPRSETDGLYSRHEANRNYVDKLHYFFK